MVFIGKTKGKKKCQSTNKLRWINMSNENSGAEQNESEERVAEVVAPVDTEMDGGAAAGAEELGGRGPFDGSGAFINGGGEVGITGGVAAVGRPAAGARQAAFYAS